MEEFKYIERYRSLKDSITEDNVKKISFTFNEFTYFRSKYRCQ